jgi:hypothetical protein
LRCTFSLTGGTALPADISPSPPAGTPEQPRDGDSGGPGQAGSTGPGNGGPGNSGPGSSGPGNTDSGSTGSSNMGAESTGAESTAADGGLPGLPRLFFGDQPDQARPGSPAGQSGQPGQSWNQPAGQPQDQFPGQPGGPSPAGQPWNPWSQPGGPGPAGQQAARQRPVRQRPTRPPERELRHRAIASVCLALFSLFALFGLGANLSRGVYLLLFSTIIGAAASIIGIIAAVKARRAGAYRPHGTAWGIALGAVAVVVSVPILATYLAFPGPMNNYVKCIGQAQTSGQQRACENQFYKQIHMGASPGSVRREIPGQQVSGRQVSREGRRIA